MEVGERRGMKVERDEQAFWDRCVFASLSKAIPNGYVDPPASASFRATQIADETLTERRSRMSESPTTPYLGDG